MANNSHPIFYFLFHSFISLGAATLYVIVSTNQFKKHLQLDLMKYLELCCSPQSRMKAETLFLTKNLHTSFT